MKKRYLVSNDEYSGQVVIICETKEVKVDTYKPTQDELSAAIYLYRELPKQMEIKTKYIVKIFYHYELGEDAYIPEGEGSTNLLEQWVAWNKDEANELFKQAINFCK